MRALEMFSCQNKKSRINESGLGNLEEVVIGGLLKVRGKVHALSSTQQREVSKALEKTMWSGHKFIFAYANL